MLDRILVGYAGDRAGRDAVALAGELAVAVKGRLTVVSPYHPFLARQTSGEAEALVRAEVAALLGGVEGSGSLAEPRCHWSSSSWPIHALHELADYEDVELIVFGAARENLADRLHVSVMERMVHGAPCAVAVSPEGYAPGIRRIGVGFSDSEEGRAAVHIARELAVLLHGTVTVIAAAGLEPALAGYAFSSPTLLEVEDDMYAETEQMLARVCDELAGGAGTPLEHETVRGAPASVLIERATGLDLMVLGSRAYGPLRHVLLGSVSARVMREAPCPVLVVPRGTSHEDRHSSDQRSGVLDQA